VARINIEDSIYKDHRFLELIIMMGGTDAALGSIVRAWSTAQDYWLQNGVGIPLPVWKKQKLRLELLEVGLAEIRGDFVYISGSEKQFLWLEQRQMAGEKGGRPKKGGSVEIISELANRTKPEETGSNPLSLSLSPSLIKKKEIEGIELCKKTWIATLRYFKHQRGLSQGEERLIALALIADSAELVNQALFGARFEPKFKDFDPGIAPDISRIVGDRNHKKASQVAKFSGYASNHIQQQETFDERTTMLIEATGVLPDGTKPKNPSI
jgi:hypothetical protein